MRKDYARFVELANEGARELGFADLGAMWRSNYDMPPDEFTQGSRAPVGSGEAAVRLTALLRARQAAEDLRRRARARRQADSRATARQHVGAAVGRNLSAGRAVSGRVRSRRHRARWRSRSTIRCASRSPPRTSTSRSASRSCRRRSGSARCSRSRAIATCSVTRAPGTWTRKDDVRIKQCIEPTQEHLMTVYHELGHVFYYLSYKDQPFLFQSGAHDGFHEAIGDTVNLSMTPAYLHQIGLLGAVKRSDRGDDQSADEARARQDRVPAVRQADRRVALESVLGRNQAGELQRRVVAAARAVSGRRRAGRAHRRRFRSGREVPHSGEHAVHALLPVVHPAVPVPQGAVRGGRASRVRCTNARCTATRKPASASAKCSRSARASRGRTRSRNSPARARWMRRRSPNISRRCSRGWKNRTRARVRLVNAHDIRYRQGRTHEHRPRPAAHGARDHSLDRPRDDPRRREHVPRLVRGPDDRHRDSRGGRVDGGAARCSAAGTFSRTTSCRPALRPARRSPPA